MRQKQKQSGFTLIEIMVVVVILMILLAGILSVGSYVWKKAKVDETKSYILLLTSALKEYKNYQGTTLKGYPSEDNLNNEYWNMQGMFLAMNEVPNCRRILDKIPPEKRGDVHDNRDPLELKPGPDGIFDTVLDAWGVPMEYENNGSGNFPTIRSAGPDKVSGNADDITSDKLL